MTSKASFAIKVGAGGVGSTAAYAGARGGNGVVIIRYLVPRGFW